MHSSTARGFYVMLLNRDEREKLRDLEKSLPQGRYFANCEIAAIFHLEIKKEERQKTDIEIATMDELWRQFNKEIWKAKKMVKMRFDKAKAMAIDMEKPMIPGQMIQAETPNGQEDPMDDDAAAFGNFCGMDAEERFNWGEYVLGNYRRPRGHASSMDEAFGMAS
jgi:hypothetical protein